MSSDDSPKRKKKSRKRPNTKLTGERSEAAFLHRAAALGFGVAKPWGDSLRCDFILDNGQRLWRVQVKCTETLRPRLPNPRHLQPRQGTRRLHQERYRLHRRPRSPARPL